MLRQEVSFVPMSQLGIVRILVVLVLVKLMSGSSLHKPTRWVLGVHLNLQVIQFYFILHSEILVVKKEQFHYLSCVMPRES